MAATLRRALDLRDDDLGLRLIIVNTVFLSLATLAVALRLASRGIKRKRLASDDYWIILALIVEFAHFAIAIYGVVAGGLGRHIRHLTPGEIELTLKVKRFKHLFSVFTDRNHSQRLIAAQILWSTAVWMVKLSILCLFVQIFAVRSFRTLAYFTMVIATLFALSNLLFTLLQCRPLAYQWDRSIQGECYNQRAGWLGTGIVNIITDIMVLSLPIRPVWDLRLPRRSKAVLTIVFCIGFLICVFSILRIVSILTIDLADITYTETDVDIYSILEPTLGIICACVPVMGPFFDRIDFSHIRSHLRLGSYPTRREHAQEQHSAWTRSETKATRGTIGTVSTFRTEAPFFPCPDDDTLLLKNIVAEAKDNPKSRDLGSSAVAEHAGTRNQFAGLDEAGSLEAGIRVHTAWNVNRN